MIHCAKPVKSNQESGNPYGFSLQILHLCRVFPPGVTEIRNNKWFLSNWPDLCCCWCGQKDFRSRLCKLVH